MRAAALVALLVAGVVTGCGVTSTGGGGISYPVGPSLAELRVRERCAGEDQSCQERAQEMVRALLGGLGAPAADPSMQSPDDPRPDGRLLIIFDSDPPFAWQATDGASGTAERVVVDLTGALRGGESYAVVAPGVAYEIGAEQAEELLFSLFVLTD